MTGRQRTLLVDSSIYVFRAWFALPESLVGRDGAPVNAVIGFSDFVLRLLTQAEPARVGFAFDESLAGSFRHDLYPEYKANRSPAPESLKRQFGLCRELVRALGIAGFASNCYEADDLIGTLARMERETGRGVAVVTADKDLMQVVAADDLWWEFHRDLRLDARGVEKRLGVRPNQVADQLALAGDKVDNIPGVPGIGMATAASLLRRFDDLDTLFSDMAAVAGTRLRGAARLAMLLAEHEGTVRMARRLTGVHCDAKLPPGIDLIPSRPDKAALDELFERLGLGVDRRTRWKCLISRLSQA